MSLTGEELYKQREQRFTDIVALKKPDRVPVIPLNNHYFATRRKGISNSVAGFDDQKRYDAIKDATIEFGWDFAPGSPLYPSNAYAAIAATQIRWPGGDLADDDPFQFVEDEYMKAEEYDEFLADPDRFTLTKIYPRIATNLAGLGQVPLPPLHWMADVYFLMFVGGPLLAAPPIRKAVESLLAMSDAVAANAAVDAAHVKELAALGYPRAWSAGVIPAFDMISDMLRSLRGSTLDMYRHPDKLLAAVDLKQQAAVSLAVASIELTGNPRVFIPMHRGGGGFMSDEQFEKFYWPSFKALILAIVDAGGVPCPLFEGDYTPRLKYLAELPGGKVAGHFDKVDRVKFKEILGDRMCFWGNVPASLLCTGTPQQVKDDVKELVDLFGDTGALIIDSGLGAPDEAKPENMMALREAADDYGMF
jgi:hypothetical protein